LLRKSHGDADAQLDGAVQPHVDEQPDVRKTRLPSLPLLCGGVVVAAAAAADWMATAELVSAVL
jgi:hypothetical protein